MSDDKPKLRRYRIELEIEVATDHKDETGTRRDPACWRAWSDRLNLQPELGEKVRRVVVGELEPLTEWRETSRTYRDFPR